MTLEIFLFKRKKKKKKGGSAKGGTGKEKMACAYSSNDKEGAIKGHAVDIAVQDHGEGDKIVIGANQLGRHFIN